MLPIAAVAAVFVLPKVIELIGRIWLELRKKKESTNV